MRPSAGRRIAVTGATGFLGTALVERLLRTVPDCELVLLVRPGRRGAAERVRREILRNDCFDRLRARARRPLRRRDGRAGSRPIAGDVGTDGLGLDDDGRALLAACDIVIHSAATVSFDSPLDGAVEVNLLGPTRVAAAIDSGRHAGRPPAPPGRRVDRLRGRHPAGRRARGHPARDAVRHRGRPGGPRSAAARRARADADAASRDPKLLHPLRQAGPGRARRRRHPGAGRQGREAPRGVGQGPHGRARQGPGPGARLARRLRLHQGPRRAGPARDPGRRARSPSCARRSSSRPWPSRVPAGSAASAWPSRSSSATPGAC